MEGASGEMLLAYQVSVPNAKLSLCPPAPSVVNLVTWLPMAQCSNIVCHMYEPEEPTFRAVVWEVRQGQ